MAWVGEAILSFHNWKNGVFKVKANTSKTENPLKIGILGAAAINYAGLIDPIQSHADAIVAGIAARSLDRAQAQINANKLGPDCKAYGSYQELIDDDNIEAVYIPLPNSVHCEWAVAAMNKGKHVMIEKPIASNAEETRKIKDVADKTGRVALEAFHWRFHPLVLRLQNQIDSGVYGDLTGITVKFLILQGMFAKDDFRFSYALAGGASMDLTYVHNACRFFTGDSGTVKISEATPQLSTGDEKIDEAMEVRYTIERTGKSTVHCHTICHAAKPPLLWFIPRVWDMMPTMTLELEKARIDFPGFVQPPFSSGFTVYEKDANGKLTGKKKNEQNMAQGFEQWYGQIEGRDWWTTYRWQLEAFVGKVRAVQAEKEWTGPWITMDSSVGQMEMIDSVYDKACLPRRGER